MARFPAVLFFLVIPRLCLAQEAGLAPILNFETAQPGGAPAGWTGNPAGTVAVDGSVVHGGKWSARIERNPDSPAEFSSLSKVIPWAYGGKVIELKGFIRTQNVSKYAGLWMRLDGEVPSLAFNNMQERQLKGTTDWTEYSISFPVHPDAKQLVFGALVSGTGTAWIDDLQLLVDGKPIWNAPRQERVQTPIDLDHEFDAGSGIRLKELTRIQSINLVALGKVWGFLKYHHPAVTEGKRHWDYDLFRILPEILAASDRATANAAMLKWIDGLGPVAPCTRCAKLLTGDIYFLPALEWLKDKATLGSTLSQRLLDIYAARPGNGKQFYVSLAVGVQNPDFHHEPAYPQMTPGDTGLQILAAYRLWNIIEYWYPYRDVLDGDWNEALRETLPRIAVAETREAYQRELLLLIAKVHDTHANLWSSLNARPPSGPCRLPAIVRFVENQPVIVSAANNALNPGDVLLNIDGVAVPEILRSISPYYAASNDPTRLRDIATGIGRGACGVVALRVRRDGKEVALDITRVSQGDMDFTKELRHDLTGETFRKLSEDVGYVKLSSIKGADIRRSMDALQGTKGLIIDIRNYPSEFVVFTLGSLLVDHPTDFARFTRGDLSNPGAFHWDEKPTRLMPQAPHYSGKVVILVDEISQSQSEYTAMAFRTAPGAKVVGSTTAGADGNVSPIPLPGNLRSMISGIGVFYPDKRPTQRIGILPDVNAKPTIAGIRAGQDEVLEEGLRQILGRDIPQAEVEKMTRH